MAHTLVIKGANFGTNKIETVSFSNEIPCTSISLDKSTDTISVIGGTATVTPTVTPNNTTDSVVWTSSDNGIATVANGVVTAVGVGVVTITATCGEKTATCTVAVSNTLSFTHKLGATAKKKGSSDDYGYLDSGDANYGGLYGTAEQTYRVSAASDLQIEGYLYPVPLGDGAETLTITAGNNLKVTVVWLDKDTVCDASSGASWKAIFAKVVNYDDASPYNSNVPLGNRVLTVPTGANSIIACIRKTTADLSDADVASVSFVVSAGTN